MWHWSKGLETTRKNMPQGQMCLNKKPISQQHQQPKQLNKTGTYAFAHLRIHIFGVITSSSAHLSLTLYPFYSFYTRMHQQKQTLHQLLLPIQQKHLEKENSRRRDKPASYNVPWITHQGDIVVRTKGMGWSKVSKLKKIYKNIMWTINQCLC